MKQLMNYIKYIAALFGIALGITSFIYTNQTADFVMPKKVEVYTSTNIADKKEQLRNPILKHYQPVQLTIKNASNKTWEIKSTDISLPHHSLKQVQRKINYSIGTFNKIMLSINAILWIPFIFAGVSFGTIALTDSIPTSIVGLLIVYTFYAGLVILPLVSIPTAVGVSVKSISNYKKKARLIKTIKESTFEPEQTIVIPAHSTVIKTLFCPKKELPETFEVTMTESETGEQNTAQLSLAETL
jgi:hypothetical protein